MFIALRYRECPMSRNCCVNNLQSLLVLARVSSQSYFIVCVADTITCLTMFGSASDIAYIYTNPNPTARNTLGYKSKRSAQRHKVTSTFPEIRRDSHLRQTPLDHQHGFQRTDIGAGRSRRVNRCVRAISFRLSGSWLTCDSAEWPRVLENVLQRLHQVCTAPLLASHSRLNTL